MSEDRKLPREGNLEQWILQAMLQNGMFAQQMVEVLDKDYLNDEHHKVIVETAFELFGRYREFPTRETLAIHLANNIEAPLMLQQVRGFFNAPIPKDKELDYARDESLKWCRKQKLMVALGKVIDQCSEREIPYDAIVSDINNAVAVGSEKNFGHVWKQDIEERFTEGRRKPVGTPWEVLNELVAGGLSGGELGVILALTGVGKSHALVDLGVAAAMQGLNVVHFTFELSEVMVGKRYDARIAGVPFDHLPLHRGKVEVALKALDDTGGSIHIKKYPNRDASCLTLQNYVNRLTAAGTKPDLLIVDYADIMKSGKSYENKRFEEEAVYEQLRSLADELNIPIWTASQVNRSGMDVEVLTLKHIAECFAKANIADLFLTMNRKKNNDYNAMLSGDYETIGNMFVAKSRLGPDGVKLNILVNTALSQIKCLRPGSDAEESAMAKHDLALESDTSRMRRHLDDTRKSDGPHLRAVPDEKENNEYQR